MTNDDESTLTPEETLRLIDEQQSATVKRLKGDPLLLYVPWGVAWLLGFTTLFLHYGLDGVPYAPISQNQAVAVLMGAQMVAGAAAAYGIVKMQVRARGVSSTRGAMYGYSWFIAFVLMSVICVRMSLILPPAEAGLLWGAVSFLVVAVHYMLGGAIWLEKPMFFIGVWTAAVTGAGVLLGPGWHALLAAVLLGGGYIVIGLWLRSRS